MPRVTVDALDWKPTASQWAAASARAKVVALMGGYGSGKTRTGSEITLDLAAENAGLAGMIVAPTYGLLRRVILPTFLAACPRQIIAQDATRDATNPYLRLINGSTIYLGSATNPGSLEGSNLAWFWVDEGRLISAAAWQVIIGRHRVKGAKRLQGIVTTTPAAGWLQEEFGSPKQGRATVHISTRENVRNLAPGFIEDLERTYSARLAQRLIEGRFGASELAVYGSFEPERHVIDWRFSPERGRLAGVVDFGRRRPAFLLFQQPLAGEPLSNGRQALDGTWICVAEHHPEQVTTPALIDGIKSTLRARGVPQRPDGSFEVSEWYCDPAGNQQQAIVGVSDVHMFERSGLGPMQWCTDDVLTFIPRGVEIVDGMLLNTRGETRLYVSRDIADGGQRGIVKSLQGYSYKPGRGSEPISDQPVKDGVTDHACDALRYLIVNTYVPPGGWDERHQVQLR